MEPLIAEKSPIVLLDPVPHDVSCHLEPGLSIAEEAAKYLIELYVSRAHVLDLVKLWRM